MARKPKPLAAASVPDLLRPFVPSAVAQALAPIKSKTSDTTNTPVTGRRRLGAGLFATVIGSGITAGVAASVADLVPAGPDAELISLGRQLVEEQARADRAYATATDRSDKALDAIAAPVVALVHRIEHMQAHTLAGMHAKALAISWCCDGEDIGPDQFSPYEGATTDARIAVSIVRDLLQIGGVA